MKSIIIRKPKFMRSEASMHAYLTCYRSIIGGIDNPDLTRDEVYDRIKRAGNCLNKAAEAGGFFNTQDLIKWLLKYETT